MDQLGLKREIGRHLWESFWKLPDPLFPGLSILNLIGVEFYTRKEKKKPFSLFFKYSVTCELNKIKRYMFV